MEGYAEKVMNFSCRCDIGHTGVTVIEFSGKQGEFAVPKILQMANDSHLYKDGLGTRYQNRVYL